MRVTNTRPGSNTDETHRETGWWFGWAPRVGPGVSRDRTSLTRGPSHGGGPVGRRRRGGEGRARRRQLRSLYGTILPAKQMISKPICIENGSGEAGKRRKHQMALLLYAISIILRIYIK